MKMILTNSYKVVFGEHCLAGGAAGAVKSEELHSLHWCR